MINKSVSIESIAKVWKMILRTRCPLNKKTCDPNCGLCHKPLVYKKALYPDIQKLDDTTKIFSIRTPYILKLPQIYLITRIVLMQIPAVKKVFVPLSFNNFFMIIREENRVLIKGSPRRSVEFELSSRDFLPPYLVIIPVKHLENVNIEKMLEISSEIKIVKRNGVKNFMFFTEKITDLMLRFQKITPGLILGNPRIFSNNKEMFVKIAENIYSSSIS